MGANFLPLGITDCLGLRPLKLCERHGLGPWIESSGKEPLLLRNLEMLVHVNFLEAMAVEER